MKEFCAPEHDRICVPRRSADTATGQFGLPNDLIESAVTRLGWLGLIYSATLNAVHWTRTYALPPQAAGISALPALVYVGLVAGTVLGITVCALAWTRRIPAHLMLDVGLIFQVLAGFCIALMENSNPLLAQGWVRGISGLALWTVFFVLVIPSSLGKTILAAFASAAMGPLALLIYNGFYGIRFPEAGISLSVFVPDFYVHSGPWCSRDSSTEWAAISARRAEWATTS